MAWQQSDLDALDAMIASQGTIRSVTFADGRQTTYQDADKLVALRREMKAELIAARSALAPRLRSTVGRMCRG